MIKILVDAFGGDYSPDEIIAGGINAINKCNDFIITFVGDENIIKEKLKLFIFDKSRIEILNATDVILNNDKPTEVYRKKPNSSMAIAFDTLRKNDDYGAFISAGSTGSLLVGAFTKLGRINGVSRPALCPFLPTIDGKSVCIADCGANIDVKPINLVHFAIMSNIYFKIQCGIDNPKIGLLNVGVEEEKGSELIKESFSLLQNTKGINFIGNVEARQLLSGDVDIYICDGFNGNILLKSTEGAVSNLLKLIKTEITSGFKNKIGALLLKGAFKKVKLRMDYKNKGGAILLGVKKIVIKAHGNSKRETIMATILQSVKLVKSNIIKNIENEIGCANAEQ